VEGSRTGQGTVIYKPVLFTIVSEQGTWEVLSVTGHSGPGPLNTESVAQWVGSGQDSVLMLSAGRVVLILVLILLN